MGKVYIITKALYCAAFRAFLVERLDEMGFKSSISDPDIWLHPEVKPYGEQYYEFVLVYVDDILGIIINAMEVLLEIYERYKFKKNKIKPPEIYLGRMLENKNLNGLYM